TGEAQGLCEGPRALILNPVQHLCRDLNMAAHGRSLSNLSEPERICREEILQSSCAELVIQYHFNGRLLALYNSSTEKVLGFTEYGKRLASNLNKDSGPILKIFSFKASSVCHHAIPVTNTGLVPAVPPVASLRRDRPEVAGGPVVLICSAYDFYPRQIKVSWLRDGVVVPEMEVMEKLVSVSWRYQIHSYLKEPAGEGLNIQCMVKHQSLPEPMLLRLDRSDLDSGAVQSAVGVSILSLGALVLLGGGIFYWRRASGRLRRRDSFPAGGAAAQLHIQDH
uniref:Ig-like domain-containing protein n=1 Tax=Myripristis murdjan TaxID=586833 RepID=A0A667ZYM2_9TELE